MKLRLLTILLIMQCVNSLAQNFDKRFSLVHYTQELLQVDQWGNSYIVNQTINLDINVTKADILGNLLWSKSYGAPNTREVTYDIIIGPNGNLYMCGFRDGAGSMQGLIMSLDSSGNQVFCKVLGLTDEFTGCTNLISDVEGFTLSVFFSGIDTTGGTKLMKFDWNGNILKEKVINGIGRNIYWLNDTTYVLYSSSNLVLIDSSFQNSHFIMSISISGGGKILKLVKGLNGFLYALHVESIIPFDSTFIPQRQIKFGVSPDSFPGYLYDMHQILSDSTWLIVGFHHHESFSPGLKDHVVLMHTDQNFIPIKSTCLYSDLYIENPLGGSPFSKSSIRNERMIFASSAKFDTSLSRANQLRILSFDSSLAGLCNSSDTIPYIITTPTGYHIPSTNFTYFVPCTTSVQDIIMQQRDEYLSSGDCSDLTVEVAGNVVVNAGYSIYPNPCNEFLSVDIRNFQYEILNFEIYNSIGYIKSFEVLNNNHRGTIDTSTLSNGIYFLRCVETGEVVRFVRQ